VSFFPRILLFDVWVTISKDVEVYSIVVHWFFKASGFLLLEVLALQQPNDCFLKQSN
jgi:hypothetical protein